MILLCPNRTKFSKVHLKCSKSKSEARFGISFGHWFQNWFRIFVLSTQSTIFGVPKSLILGIFGYPKNGTFGAQHEKFIPVLESVTKTDSKNGFELKFRAFLRSFANFGCFFNLLLHSFVCKGACKSRFGRFLKIVLSYLIFKNCSTISRVTPFGIQLRILKISDDLISHRTLSR